MRKIEFDIEDEMHGEPQGVHFDTFDGAFNKLVEWAQIPYGTPPNLCPCTNWNTCHRLYSIIEYDKSHVPWDEINRKEILEVSAGGIKWLASIEDNPTTQ